MITQIYMIEFGKFNQKRVKYFTSLVNCIKYLIKLFNNPNFVKKYFKHANLNEIRTILPKALEQRIKRDQCFKKYEVDDFGLISEVDFNNMFSSKENEILYGKLDGLWMESIEIMKKNFIFIKASMKMDTIDW